MKRRERCRVSKHKSWLPFYVDFMCARGMKKKVITMPQEWFIRIGPYNDQNCSRGDNTICICDEGGGEGKKRIGDGGRVGIATSMSSTYIVV